MIPIQTTNAITSYLLDFAVRSAALATCAAAVSSPMGAGGGAILGVVTRAVDIPLTLLTKKVFSTDCPEASFTTKVVVFAAKLFSSYAVAWALASYAGLSLSFAHVVAIGVIGSLIAVPISLMLKGVMYLDEMTKDLRNESISRESCY